MKTSLILRARWLVAACALVPVTSCTRAEIPAGRNDPANPHAATLPLRTLTPLSVTPAAEASDAAMAAPAHMHHHGGMVMGHGGGTGMMMEEPALDGGMKMDGETMKPGAKP